MPSRRSLRLAVLLAPLLSAAAPARAQRIDGLVVSARDSAPVVGALLQLLDSGDTRVAQTSSGSDGAFRLAAPAAGPFLVAVLRIGQHPWRSAPLDLANGLARRVTLVVPDDPVQLAAISVEASSACRAAPDDRTLIGDLLAEAQKALALTRLAIERRSVGYGVLLWRRTRTLRFATTDSTWELVVDAVWPIRSAPPESLAVHGFVREEAPADAQAFTPSTYYGPDAAALFSPWFLDTHCFHVSEGAGDDADAVVVAFDPARGRRGADISGRLVIERAGLTLRRIEWRYVGLPWWVTSDAAGGAVTLARLPSGIVIPWRWWLRAPVAEVDRSRRTVRLARWEETGGETLLPSVEP
jgi:hypothetical protein